MFAPFSKFYGNIWVGFFLNTARRFFLRRFILKQAKRVEALKKVGMFYVTIRGIFERFQYFNFETDFLENENLFQKTGVSFFS